MTVVLHKCCAIIAGLIGLLVWANSTSAQAAAPRKATQTKLYQACAMRNLLLWLSRSRRGLARRPPP
jgi:hypothetical protein